MAIQHGPDGRRFREAALARAARHRQGEQAATKHSCFDFVDGLMWQDYTAPVELTENGKVYFRAADAAGNESGIISYEVSNIKEEAITAKDTTPPVVTNTRADITAPTNQDVTVTAEFTDNIDISTKEYKFEGESDDEWKPYSDAGVTVSKNTIVYFKAIDTAGNESEVVILIR